MPGLHVWAPFPSRGDGSRWVSTLEPFAVIQQSAKIAQAVRRRLDSVKSELRKKSTVEGWVLPKQESSWAPAGTWTNIDLDVTPPARRTWTSLTILGYWFSDVISMQSWETGSTILALGLTW